MWWHVLEVESSADEKTVKKAYAKIIRGIDQDTDIEEFTRINDAYRLATKSFKKELRSRLLLGEANESFYINALNKIYSSPRRRLRSSYWKNIFACMTFKEEEEFSHSCVEFFNEHYILPKEVWTLINKNYLLGKHKLFKWKELSEGIFSVTNRELEGMESQEALDFLEGKIKAFYLMLDKDYDTAISIIKVMVDGGLYDKQVLKWLMVGVMGRGDPDEVFATYKMIKLKDPTCSMVDLCYAAYLTVQGANAKSLSLLNKIDESMNEELLSILIAENKYYLGEDNQEPLSYMPWNEIESLNKKERKALSSGHYHRLDPEANKRGLFSGLRRG